MISSVITPEEKICLQLNQDMAGLPLFGPKRENHPDQKTPWRISPEPFALKPEELLFFNRLGEYLLAFYRASNKLYFESAKGRMPSWIAQYLDQGKNEDLLDYGRMNRFRGELPGIIRPDLFFTEAGPVISELDSIPGGIGFTGWLGKHYSRQGFKVVGGENGMAEGFAGMIRHLVQKTAPNLAIVLSQESSDYYEEMTWLAEALNQLGLNARTVRPEQLAFNEEGLLLDGEPLDILYRFFELFDLRNIPKSELILYSNKKGKVRLTPPCKAYLEEKLWFALFHHPVLTPYWQAELGEKWPLLHHVIPETWILDPRELPPHAVIPGITINGRAVHRWEDLKETTKKERDFVLKVSGFSPLAWGSKSVAFGGDLSGEGWDNALTEALQSQTPFVLQKYHKPLKTPMRYWDFNQGQLQTMEGRTRLCPYYFVEGEQVHLGGILATACPANKRAIHGMTEAVMAPCYVPEV